MLTIKQYHQELWNAALLNVSEHSTRALFRYQCKLVDVEDNCAYIKANPKFSRLIGRRLWVLSEAFGQFGKTVSVDFVGYSEVSE